MDSYDFVDLLAVERADELFCIRLAVFEVLCRSRLSEIGEGHARTVSGSVGARGSSFRGRTPGALAGFRGEGGFRADSGQDAGSRLLVRVTRPR